MSRSRCGLVRTSWLNLWTVVWFVRVISRLAWTDFRLTWTVDLSWPVSRSGTRDARLRSDGARRSNHGRTASVHVVELLTVLRGFALDLELRGHGRRAWAAEGCDLRWLRSRGKATPATVVGNASVVVDDHGAVVNMSDVDEVNSIDRAVVIEVVPTPVAAVVAESGIAEAVINTAIEADMRTPVPSVKAPTIVVPAPVTGGPKSAIVGGRTPGAGNPVVAGRCPVPVAGRPEIVGSGSLGLIIFREGRRRFVSVFDRGELAVCVELLSGLCILKRLVLTRGWGRSGLLRSGLLRTGSILLGVLLRLGLRTKSKHGTLSSGSCGRLRLAVVDRRHIGVGGVRARVVGYN